jgi:Hsp20/alpha crystallin family protein
MTKPVPDKAEIALKYLEKLYVGTFERSSRFEAHLDATGFALILDRPGDEEARGSFYRSMSLPFEPEDGAVEAHFDKGVLHLTIKKLTKVMKSSKTIDVKTGAPPNKA